MDLTAQIRSALQSQGLPVPSAAWVQGALPTRTPLPPLPALVATVRARLLAADLTAPSLGFALELDDPRAGAPAVLPPRLADPQVREARLARDVPVQVLDVEDLSRSRWEQVEELEAVARGERTRGREMVRLLPVGHRGDDGDSDDDDDDYDGNPATSTITTQPPSVGGQRPGQPPTSSAAGAATTHRLVLQDCRGQRVHGLELRRVDRVGVGSLHVGEKLLLRRGAVVARGVVLLEPQTCTVLGGRVEAWQRAWSDGRLERLRAAAVGGAAGADAGAGAGHAPA
ncbi:hypothetical protein GGR56DRAFT_675491 [Xylariaceae sp. FL0804]|nr:hypothetical protein GGR56DRAFT_675491 [Xylariaceae sp. FL0804]